MGHSDPATAGEESRGSEATRAAKKLIDSSASTALGLRMTKKFTEAIISFFIILFLGLITYILPFYLHFRLLTQSGPGDAFMSTDWRNELKYGRENVYQPLNFWQKFTELNKTMLTANAGITAEHPFGSRWYSWPLDKKAVYYWNQENTPGHPGWAAQIYLYGNPVLWYLALAGLIFSIAKMLTKKGRRQLEPIFYILVLAYLANLLPFIFIKRVAFLYHYLPPLAYVVLLLSLRLNQLWPQQKKTLLAAFAFILLGFLVLIPLSYGWPLPVNPSRLVI
jgi:dolichyl-phosphate-mannose--protein O-mannosyl transferase